jgi:hypothetical protein
LEYILITHQFSSPPLAAIASSTFTVDRPGLDLLLPVPLGLLLPVPLHPDPRTDPHRRLTPQANARIETHCPDATDPLHGSLPPGKVVTDG